MLELTKKAQEARENIKASGVWGCGVDTLRMDGWFSVSDLETVAAPGKTVWLEKKVLTGNVCYEFYVEGGRIKVR